MSLPPSSGSPAPPHELSAALGPPDPSFERLQSLREAVQSTLNAEFHVVAGDLEQLRGLLGDAASKLSSAFRVMTACTDEIQRTARLLRESPDEKALARLTALTQEMTSTTGTTVQSLQFEDMATQLLAHVGRRLGILESFSKDMAMLNPISDARPPFLTAASLDALESMIETYRRDLAEAGRKAVRQQSLDSGDIELF